MPQRDSSTTAKEEMAVAMAKLWHEHRREALARVETLEDAAAALAANELDAELREDARAAAHKLRGSAGTYGFHRATELAGELEDMLAGESALGLPDAPRFSSLVVPLRPALEEEPPVAPHEAPSLGAGVPTALLLSSDPELRERLTDAAAGRGIALEPAGTEERRFKLSENGWTVVIVDLEEEGEGAGFEALAELAAGPGAPQVLVLAGSGELLDRVEAVRRGARGFLDRSLDADSLLDAVERCAETLRGSRESVLAVDDDPFVLAALEVVLERHGYEVATVEDPLRFWERLEEVSPDAVVLDLDMPRVNGLELCRAVRSDPRWAGLPLLILTAYHAPELIRQGYEAGADDYLSKPIIEEELVGRVRNRLDRIRAQREAIGRDELTGLPSRRAALAGIERMARLAADGAAPMSVALLDVDRLRDVNERDGQAAGDALLRRLADRLLEEFEGEVVGRWDGDAFVVAMWGLRPAEAARRVGAVLERLREEAESTRTAARTVPATTLSVGIAGRSPTEYGDSPASRRALELLSAVERALDEAKRAGPGGMATAPGPHPASERTDVVIIEDDDSVVDVLRLALRNEQLTSRRLTDGAEAVSALVGDPPTLSARVVLLDWDLPGLDGLSVLQTLRDEGVIDRTRVIMLTARGSEAEKLRTLELGAEDFIAKPFSVPVLVERLRRALRA